MPTPRILSDEEREALWAEAKAEFPHDEVLREVHFIRLLHREQLKHLSREEHMEFFNRLIPESKRSRLS